MSAPGERIRHPEGGLVLNDGRPTRTIDVKNDSARPVRLSSHLPFEEANARLRFDRQEARGFRLDIPAGTSVRWGPGERRTVRLVATRSRPD